MAVAVLSRLVRLTFSFAAPGSRPAQMGATYLTTPAASADELDEMCAAAVTSWITGVGVGSTFASFQNDDTRLIKTHAQRLDNGVASATNLTAEAGTAVGIGMLPPECALVTTFKTGLAGPANRGRAFFPFLNVSLLEPDGSCNATSASILDQCWQQLAEDLEDAINPTTVLQVVYSAQHNTMEDVTSKQTSINFDAIRHRKPAA